MIALFLNQFSGFDVEPLLYAVADAMPALLTGNWIGFAVVVLPAIVAVLKQDKVKSEEPEAASRVAAEASASMPPRGAPDPTGAQSVG